MPTHAKHHGKMPAKHPKPMPKKPMHDMGGGHMMKDSDMMPRKKS